jgi:U3 small nucleolar RNA-associated protein 3
MARRRRQAKEPEEELPSEDEVQLFHRDRSKRLVEASRNGLDERSRRRAAVSDSDESSEEEESEVEEVIGLTGTAEDEDDEDDEDAEDAEEEEEDDGDDDDDSDDDDSDEDSDDEQDPHATKGWGVSKKNFYSGEEADSSDSDAEDGTDALAEEEAEARRLQRQRSQKLHTDDFGDVSGSDDEETLGATAASGGKKSKRQSQGKQRKKAGADGLGSLEDGAEVEELSKDLSSMSREEKLQVLISDAPELVELLSGFKDSVGQIRTQIAPLIQQVKDGKLPTSSGSSFLEVKFHLLLSYCINITFYLLLKARGEAVQDHPVIETLVKLRALIEKCGPIDLKLKYQIEKLLAAAANPSASGSDAALSHKPRPEALMGAGEDEDEDEDDDSEGRGGAAALYQVPKLSAARYDDGREESKFERKSAARRARLLKSDMVQTMQAELSDAPMEINAADPSRLRGEAAEAAKEAEERRVYEEDNFVRLTLSKSDKAKEKLRARAERGMLEDEFSSFNTEEFGELASLVSAEAEAETQAAKRSEREQKKRRTLARYLNDIEQKERKATKRGAASADSDLPWDAPEQKQPKRMKPDYNVSDDSDDEPTGAPHVEDEVYTAAVEKRQKKKLQKQEKREVAASEHAEAREMLERKHSGGKRGATRDIIKNKGLTPHRNKLDRNPRVKKKVKYAKKVKTARSSGLSGRQNTSVGGASGYAGESTGINPKVSRSTRIG